jgi:hypothetical protein
VLALLTKTFSFQSTNLWVSSKASKLRDELPAYIGEVENGIVMQPLGIVSKDCDSSTR